MQDRNREEDAASPSITSSMSKVVMIVEMTEKDI